MSVLYKLFLIFILFFSRNVLVELGVNYWTTDVLLFLISVACMFFDRNSIARKCTAVCIIIGVFVSYGLYAIYSNPHDGTNGFAFTLMMPVTVFGSIIYSAPSSLRFMQFWREAKKIVFGFYIVECGLAIVERVLKHNFFYWKQGQGGEIIQYGGFGGEENAFRSFALMGHPLMNALIVSTMMGFILISNLKLKTKLMLWSMGYLTILCFNTRGSMVGNAAILLVYILHEVLYSRQYSKKEKKKMLIFLFFSIIMGFCLIFVYGLGGRLSEMGLFDKASAMTRVDVWSIFTYFPLSFFLFGFDTSQIEGIMMWVGIEVTENFWIDYILRYGLIFLAVYIILYYKLLKVLYRGYSSFQIMVTFSTFILLASTNNSLSQLWHPIFVYLMCLVLFNPLYSNIIFNDKSSR